MKILLYSDESLYTKLYRKFAIYDADGEISGSFFDRDRSYLFHMSDKSLINYAIDPAGMPAVTRIILQKSFYNNSQILFILRRGHYMRPDIKFVLYCDEATNKIFLSEVVKDELAVIVSTPDEFESYINDEDFFVDEEYKSKYSLQKIKKKSYRKMLSE